MSYICMTLVYLLRCLLTKSKDSMLEQNIQMALSKGDINLEDAIDIREIKNIKLANQLLKVKRKAKQDREEKMQMQQQAMQAQHSTNLNRWLHRLLHRKFRWRLKLRCS
jgi:hypothetical protein